MNGFILGAIAVGFIVSFLLTKKSLEKLGYDHFAYFPFNRYLPHAKLWSSFFWLITLSLIALVALVFGQDYIPFTPA
jgi:hypothetical protein